MAFLSYKKHPRAWDSRRKILNAWVRELEDIISCWDDRHDHEGRERERAQSLLDRYKEVFFSLFTLLHLPLDPESRSGEAFRPRY